MVPQHSNPHLWIMDASSQNEFPSKGTLSCLYPTHTCGWRCKRMPLIFKMTQKRLKNHSVVQTFNVMQMLTNVPQRQITDNQNQTRRSRTNNSATSCSVLSDYFSVCVQCKCCWKWPFLQFLPMAPLLWLRSENWLNQINCRMHIHRIRFMKIRSSAGSFTPSLSASTCGSLLPATLACYITNELLSPSWTHMFEHLAA